MDAGHGCPNVARAMDGGSATSGEWRPNPPSPKSLLGDTSHRAGFFWRWGGFETEPKSTDGQVQGEAWMPEALPRRDGRSAEVRPAAV